MTGEHYLEISGLEWEQTKAKVAFDIQWDASWRKL
jgi:hypothetical protein